MYNDNDIREIEHQIKIFKIVYALILLLMAAGLAVLCIVRIAWPGFIIAPLMAFVGIAGWDLWGSKLFAYRRYLKLDETHLSEVIEGRIMECPEEIKTYNGVRFYSVEIRLPAKSETEDPVDTYFYYDCNKGQVPFAPGDRVKLTVADRCIREAEMMD